ncbi:hypothetical protein Drorol1_Dr00004070, partial [Drosera rotundifolia]
MRCPFLFATIYAMIVQFKYFVCGRYFIRQQMVNTPYLPRENANVFYMKFFSTNYANIQNFNNIHKIIYTIFFFRTYSFISIVSLLPPCQPSLFPQNAGHRHRLHLHHRTPPSPPSSVTVTATAPSLSPHSDHLTSPLSHQTSSLPKPSDLGTDIRLLSHRSNSGAL